MPAWMVHKATGTLMQARIEFDKDLASRGDSAEFEEEEQDFGEFCEDRFVELYGLKKIAFENLRDSIKGLRKSSEGHLRLRMFRLFTGLVPQDDEKGELLGEGETLFYRMVLRHLVDVLSEDHLAGLKGGAFWTHFSRPDCVKLPITHFEKVQDRIASVQQALAKRLDGEQNRTLRALLVKRERDLARMVKCCEATLIDHSKGLLLDSPVIGVNDNESKPKVFEYGNVDVGKPRTKKDPSNTKPMSPRLDVDCYLFRAIEHWIRLEEEEQQQVEAAYSSWDLNGDGRLQLDEFAHMIKYANPTAGQRRIIRAFIAASGPVDGGEASGEEQEDCVLVERLVPALRFYSLQLKDQPAAWQASAATAEVGTADGAQAQDDDAMLEAEMAAGGGAAEPSLDVAGPSLDARKKTMQIAATSVMKQLGRMTNVLRALGNSKDMENVTEEEAAVQADIE